MEHLYFLETHMELNKEIESFNSEIMKMQIEMLAGRLKDITKDYNEEDLKRDKKRFTKIDFYFFEDFKLIQTELSENKLLLENLDNGYFNFINFNIKNYKLKID